MHKLKILLAAICGELLKLYYKVGLGTIPYGINQEKVRKEKVIVSLTSYGRRVGEIRLFHCFVKLINQTWYCYGWMMNIGMMVICLLF